MAWHRPQWGAALLVLGTWSVEHMTSAQIAEAQKLAREWKPTKQAPR